MVTRSTIAAMRSSLDGAERPAGLDRNRLPPVLRIRRVSRSPPETAFRLYTWAGSAITHSQTAVLHPCVRSSADPCG